MPRKIFISFLGITNYGQCTYYKEGKSEVKDVRFVQEATIQLHCMDCDQYIFFLTSEAEQKNWKDNGHSSREGENISQEGLETRLNKLGLGAKIKTVPNLPLGVTEAEIWTVFNMIFHQIKEEDTVYLDITHAPRSIPMLLLSLIHYAKFLKRISVGGIYYGVFEPGVQPARFPILDITTFSQLQDWTSSANAFIRFGSGDALAGLMARTEQLEMANALRDFCKNISAVRYLDIYEGRDAVFLSNALRDTTRPDNVPLEPILAEVEQKIASFKERDIFNGLAAVEWCLEHNLIQQGVTILFEYVQTQVLYNLGEEDWRTEKKRNLVSWALSAPKIDKIQAKYDMGELADELMELARAVFALPYKEALMKAYLKLGQGTRHDMNHAGIRTSPKSAESLRLSLEKSYKTIKQLLNPA